MSISLTLPTNILLCPISWKYLAFNRITLCMNPIKSIIIHIIKGKVETDFDHFHFKYFFRSIICYNINTTSHRNPSKI